jgi:uncharacterized RmlC-like cupin family protein
MVSDRAACALVCPHVAHSAAHPHANLSTEACVLVVVRSQLGNLSYYPEEAIDNLPALPIDATQH